MTRMKESGIDWIGQIPEEWEVSKLEQYVDIYGRIGFRGYTTNDIVNKGEGAISYSPSNIIDYSVIDNNNTYISWSKYDESPEIQIKTGDILYVKTGSSYGKTGIVNKLSNKATINPQLVVLKPKKNTDSRLINYFLNSSVGKDQSELIVGGSTIPTITQESIKKMIFPKMSFEEQQKIADFLDKKTAQLDKVKALLEEQIQKLKDYRASLIYETVTKGLDKTAPLKDSGIDWIGQVPQGWGVKPLKYLIKFKNGYAFDSKLLTMEQTGVKVIRIGDFKPSGIDFNAALNVFTSFNSKLDFYRIRKSQILIAMSGATVGKISFVNQEPNVYSVINQRVGIIESEINKWIYYCLSTDSFTSYIQLNSNGSAQPNISSSEISDFKVGIPDDVVIQKCVKYLDNQLESINKLIQIKNQQIENINKQRQTLIFDYVTGKRRV